MRVGMNPNKENTVLTVEQYHRVIIPVYIPNLNEAYFKDGLEILKLCLQSLLHTIHHKTKITIVNNGCCDEVTTYLNQLYRHQDSIDQLLNSKINLGKVNAVFSAVKSNLEPLITIADSDVMFLPQWQTEVEKIIQAFPEAGMVSPVPSSLGYRSNFICSTVYYGMFKAKLKFRDVVDPEGLIRFEESIGRKMYSDIHLEKILSISNAKGEAVLGCGHFVATFRAPVFEHAPDEVCQHKIVGGSETRYLDLPNDRAGFLKLSTIGNYAYHLGNTIEPWMTIKMDAIVKNKEPKSVYKTITKEKTLKKWQYVLGKFIHLIFFKRLKAFYFRFKGVNVPY